MTFVDIPPLYFINPSRTINQTGACANRQFLVAVVVSSPCNFTPTVARAVAL